MNSPHTQTHTQNETHTDEKRKIKKNTVCVRIIKTPIKSGYKKAIADISHQIAIAKTDIQS